MPPIPLASCKAEDGYSRHGYLFAGCRNQPAGLSMEIISAGSGSPFSAATSEKLALPAHLSIFLWLPYMVGLMF
jgi:hypothetical protein